MPYVLGFAAIRHFPFNVQPTNCRGAFNFSVRHKGN